jgi:hypothetical protein
VVKFLFLRDVQQVRELRKLSVIRVVKFLFLRDVQQVRELRKLSVIRVVKFCSFSGRTNS